MGLERIHLYHLVRVLRVLVPLFVAGLASVFAWNYLSRPADDSDETETRLGETLSALSEGVTYVQGREGRKEFTVSASRRLGYEGGVNQLEQVTVDLHGGGGTTPDRQIRGARCGIRQEAGDMVHIECEGSVEIDLDPRTTVRTERLSYDYRSEAVSSAVPVEIVRPGEFEVRADGIVVQFRERVLHLDGNVRVLRADGSRMEAGQVWYHEGEQRVTAAEGLGLLSAAMTVSGGRGEVLLIPETLAVSHIEIREDVRVRSLDPGDPGSMTGDALDADLRNGQMARVEARGGVVAESGEGSSRQTLSGDEITVAFDPDGAVESFQSTGNAGMTLASGETISSRRIHRTAGGTIETAEDSLLRAGDTTVRGARFRIETAGAIGFATDERASIAFPSGVLEGDRTSGSFDPDSGKLAGLRQTGSVRFELDSREGTADQVDIDETWIEFRGTARIREPAFTLDADTIRLNRVDDTFEADGSVLLVSRSGAEPVFVTSERLRGAPGDRLRFSGSAVLRQSGGQIRAALLDVDPNGSAFTAEGDVDSTRGDVRVWSDSLRFDEPGGLIEYSGRVRAESDELRMTSRTLAVTLVDGAVERMDAAGDVQVEGAEGLRGSGEGAIYRRADGTVTLSGPEAEATDPRSGTCRGDEIIVDIRTNDVSVGSRTGGQSVCVPFAVPDGPVSDESGPGSR